MDVYGRIYGCMLIYTAPVLWECDGVHRESKVVFACPKTVGFVFRVLVLWRGVGRERGRALGGAGRGGREREASRRPTATVCERKRRVAVASGVLAGVRETGGSAG